MLDETNQGDTVSKEKRKKMKNKSEHSKTCFLSYNATSRSFASRIASHQASDLSTSRQQEKPSNYARLTRVLGAALRLMQWRTKRLSSSMSLGRAANSHPTSQSRLCRLRREKYEETCSQPSAKTGVSMLCCHIQRIT
jgi:hypothetical protein